MSWLGSNSQYNIEEEKKTKPIVITRHKQKLKDSIELNSDDSFDLNDNKNDFYSKPIKKVPSRNSRKVSGFELEMNKYGLLENIKQIKQFNFYLGVELGSPRKEKEQVIINKRGINQPYEFPYQRRARSSSPPRGVIPFHNIEKSISNGNKVIIGQKNFVIEAVNKNKGGFEVREIAEGIIDSFGLSTNPTEEGRKDPIGEYYTNTKIHT